MKTRLEVVCFRNEDVIATSRCQDYGLHYYVTDAALLELENGSPYISYTGEYYLYTAENGLEYQNDSHGQYFWNQQNIANGFTFLEKGKWYHLDDDLPWKGTLCVPQTH